jgi:cystathionine gamma-synthase
MSEKDWGDSTRSVHLAAERDEATGAIVAPVAQSSAFAFPDLAAWRSVAEGRTPGDMYSRNSNPTTRRFEARVAALEGAEAAVAFATGMAAVSTTLFALLQSGQRAVTVRDAYGATFLLFTEILPRFGIDCVVLDTDDADGLVAEVEGGCDLVYLESPTNPTLKIVDIERVATAARSRGATVVVDNTFATPVNQRPLALGADLVIHSATKYLGGHDDCLGGVVCGAAATLGRIHRHLELTGPSLDPHSASLLLRSLKTLGLRMARHNDTALRLAGWLEEHPAVERVWYPGIESHPRHELARRQMRGFGGVLSFQVRGGDAAVDRLLSRLRLAYLAPNLGQVETVVGPASLTSHLELSPRQIEASGVPASLIRYAVGIEDCADLRDDLEQALAGL